MWLGEAWPGNGQARLGSGEAWRGVAWQGKGHLKQQSGASKYTRRHEAGIDRSLQPSCLRGENPDGYVDAPVLALPYTGTNRNYLAENGAHYA